MSQGHVTQKLEASEARRLCMRLSDGDASPEAKVEAYRTLARLARQQAQGGRAGAVLPEVHQVVAEGSKAAVGTLQALQETGLKAAAVLLLGHALAGLPEPLRMEAVPALCQHLNESQGAYAGQSELIAGIAAALQTLVQESSDQAAWLLACMLRQSSSYGSTTASVPHVNAIAPLYAALRTTAAACLSGPPATALTQLDRLLSIAEAALNSDHLRLRSVGVLATGGLLQGALQAPQQLLPDLEAATVHMRSLMSWAARTAGGPSTANDDCGLWQLWQDSAALACTHVHQATRQLELDAGALRCLLGCLLHSALSLQPLFAAPASVRSPQEASAELRALAAGPLAQAMPALARTVCEAFGTLTAQQRQAAWSQLSAFAARLGTDYGAYVARTSPEWLQDVDSDAVRQVLSRAFLAVVTLLDSLWRSEALEPHRQAARALGALAWLQFCRVRTSVYSLLLKDALAAAASSPEGCVELSQQLPCYAELTGASANLPGVTPPWLADSVLAARVQFLLSMLTPCATHLPSAGMERVAPVALLYLQHWHAAVATSAHNLIAVLIEHTPQGERLVPMYVQRSLDAYPHVTPLAGLNAGIDAVARSQDAPLVLLCSRRLSARIEQLSREGGAGDKGARPAGELAKLLAHVLTVVDLQALSEVMDIAEQCLQTSLPAVRAQLCSAMLQILAGSDDYTRKVACAQWYQRTAAKCLQ